MRKGGGGPKKKGSDITLLRWLLKAPQVFVNSL